MVLEETLKHDHTAIGSVTLLAIDESEQDVLLA